MAIQSVAKPVTDAVFARLNGSTELKALLAAHVLGGTKKAIYTAPLVDDKAALPYVITYGQDVIDNGTKNSFGIEVTKDIYFYTANAGSSALIEDIGDIIYKLFHRQPLTVTGYAYSVLCECVGPFDVPTSREYIGQAITVRLKLHV